MPPATIPAAALMDRDLAAVDPEIARWIEAERRRQNEGIELIASENWVVARRPRGAGLRPDQQVRRGLPRQALLRGLRVRGQGRAARHRPREGALLGRARQRPAALGLAGQHGRVPHGPEARRHDPRHGPLPRRPSDARPSTRPSRAASTRSSPTASGRRTSGSTTTRSPRLAREHRPKMIIAGASAYAARDRLREIRRDRQRGRRRPDVRHRSHRRSRHRRPARVPGSARSLRHHDDAQDAARTPRRASCCAAPPHAKDLDRSVFPGVQGGPLEHVIAAKAVAFAEAATPEFVAYQKRVVANAKALAAGLSRRGYRLVSGGTDNHLVLVDVGEKGIYGQGRRECSSSRSASPSTRTRFPSTRARRWWPRGIRLGTPAVTTRGMGSAEMDVIGASIARTLEAGEDAAVRAEVRRTVSELCAAYPLA